MEFCLLGPLVVARGDAVVPVQAGKQRAVLAALLLNANRVVAVEELAETLWGAAPPPSARLTVQNYVLRLRKALGDAGRSRITTQPPGYVISVAAGELDLTRFEVLLGAARQAARGRSWDTAAAQARAALALWRGEPLADVESDLLAVRELPRLADLRLQALETRIDADLHLGQHAEVTGELRQLVDAHPLREHLHALLMLALYRDGRQVEALAAYQAARRILTEELGVEPGRELQSLHEQVLAADPALDLSGPQRLPGAERVVPHDLPATVRHFTGRAGELAALTRLLDERAQGVVVVSAIGGTAGVGKTALAVHWAHHVAEQFPNGQLYVNLRGYDPDQPVTAADALARFLRALGVEGQAIPAGEEERAAKFRSLLTGKRMLLVLDNASDAAQVRPLLPGGPGCAVVVTSRDALAGLVARDGAVRLDLDLLPLQDAVELLRKLIGSRAGADPAAAEQLAVQCCRLPLALRVAAELAAARPAALLHDLVAELSDQQLRLDLLDAGGDQRTAVRAVFSWSYGHLDAEAARGFRLAGLHPGPDLDPYAIAALTATPLGQARHVLDVLARAHLIQPATSGRYGMHDLLRAYARELATATDGEQEEHAALTLLFDYYLAAAATAMDILYSAEAHWRPRIATTQAFVPAMPDEASARGWLDQERPNLAAAVAYCAGSGWPRHATDLAATIFRYLTYGSHLTEAQVIYGHALQAARLSGDLAAEANALNGLGGIGIKKGHFRGAASHYQAALERYRQCSDRQGEARVLQNLGVTEQQLHNHESAADYYRRAISAYEDADDSLGAVRALTYLATAEAELGRYDQAAEDLQRALPILREANDQVREAEALAGIGELVRRQGQLTLAAEYFEQALTIFRRADSPTGAADQLYNLGNVSLRQNEHQQAIGYLRQAIAQYRQAGEQHGEAATLMSLAEALLEVGQSAAARAELTSALRLATETGNTYQQASVHRDLAGSYHDAGEDEQARHHWQEALALFTELDAPEVEEVRARLAAAGEQALA